MHDALAKLKFDKEVAALTPDYAEQAGWTVNEKTYPFLDITVDHTQPVRLRLNCDKWNELPPDIEILKPDGSLWTGPLPPGNVFNPGNHVNPARPFICTQGSRAYHCVHHTPDGWANYKGKDGMGLLGILLRLVSHWRKNIS